jgi:hypothetical protein
VPQRCFDRLACGPPPKGPQTIQQEGKRYKRGAHNASSFGPARAAEDKCGKDLRQPAPYEGSASAAGVLQLVV